MNDNLGKDVAQPNKLIEKKEKARKLLITAEQTATEKKAALVEAQLAQREVAAGNMQEVRKILEVHRRVIKALTEAQVSLLNRNLSPALNSKTSENLSTSTGTAII